MALVRLFALCSIMQPCLITVAPKPVDVVVGCSSNDECPEYAACLNGACRNPCAYDDPCAPNAFCKVIFHSAKCACPAGYIGDPQTECRLPPRKTKITILSCIRCVIKWVMSLYFLFNILFCALTCVVLNHRKERELSFFL